MVRITRRAIVAALAIAAVVATSTVQAQGDGLKGMLADASDSALDKLSKPGAFSADDAIRIALPGKSKGLSSLMKLSDQGGLTNDIGGSLNRAAEQAAAEAKPIFRAAIDRMTLRDAVAIGTGGDTAATDYLRKTSGSAILAKLTPIVRAALVRSGVFQQTGQLASLGMTDAKITDYVSTKTSDGIFTYIGREETEARRNPLETGKAVLKGLKF